MTPCRKKRPCEGATCAASCCRSLGLRFQRVELDHRVFEEGVRGRIASPAFDRQAPAFLQKCHRDGRLRPTAMRQKKQRIIIRSPYLFAANSPRSVFLNRASCPFVLISRVIAA